jgi:hypothetical protein
MAVHITIDEENTPFWCGINDAQITGMNQAMRIGGKDLSIVEKFISCADGAIKLSVFFQWDPTLKHIKVTYPREIISNKQYGKRYIQT